MIIQVHLIWARSGLEHFQGRVEAVGILRYTAFIFSNPVSIDSALDSAKRDSHALADNLYSRYTMPCGLDTYCRDTLKQ
jgi:hypothetical protein